MGKLIAIVGPTASGKSALGMELAENYQGEIICADSRTVYRYMNIGTAKPSQAEMLQIKHHLVNVCDPDESFSAAEFKQQALSAIEKITNDGDLPIMVGGTGLYIDSVLYDYQFPESNSELRQELQGLSLDQLVQRLEKVDPDVLEMVDIKNPRRVIRAIETAGQPRAKSKTLRSDTLVLGMARTKEIIQSRVQARVEEMLRQGFLDEVKDVGDKFGYDCPAFSGIGYRAFRDVIRGTKSVEQATQEFVQGDLNLAKRQMTWFKRDRNIHWVESIEQADELVGAFLGV
jgi:tRNA dimethylallyltransferase